MDCTVEKEETSIKCAPAKSTTTIWIMCRRTAANKALCDHVNSLAAGADLFAPGHQELLASRSVGNAHQWAGGGNTTSHPCLPRCPVSEEGSKDNMKASTCTGLSPDPAEGKAGGYLLKLVSTWYCKSTKGGSSGGGSVRVFVFVDRPTCPPSPAPGSITITVTFCSAPGGTEPGLADNAAEAEAAAADALSYALAGDPLCVSPCTLALLDADGKPAPADADPPSGLTLDDAERTEFATTEGKDGDVKCLNFSWSIPFVCRHVVFTPPGDITPPGTPGTGAPSSGGDDGSGGDKDEDEEEGGDRRGSWRGAYGWAQPHGVTRGEWRAFESRETSRHMASAEIANLARAVFA